MHEQKIKIIAVVGPTSTGKSDLAVHIAKRFKGEIVSADSRQVYKGMNLGTGKIAKKEMDGIKHYLLNVANPKAANFNVTKFQRMANKAIKEITSKGKLPIIVGGTGFWIDALVNNIIFPDVPQNKTLRKTLENKSAKELFSMLKKLNPKRAENIDPYNKVRLIRAIEIAKSTKDTTLKQGPAIYKPLYIGLAIPQEKLYGKIDKRLKERIKKGMISEVKKLRKNGVSWKKLYTFGLEYRFVSEYLQGKMKKHEMVEKLSYAIKHYSKRQKTWFKANKKIIWFDPTKKGAKQKITKRIKDFLG